MLPRPPVPSQPAPSPESMLAAAVEAGNVAQARAVFDSSFWKAHKLVPAWELAEKALRAENTNMLRLLVTHGAVASDRNLARLREQTRERYTRYVRLLRTAGMKLTPEQLKPYAAMTAEQLVEKIPQEWKRVREVLGSEALIAGGALRDTANGAPVKDVDIFLPMPRGMLGIDRECEMYIIAAFDKAGLKIHNETLQRWHEYGLKTSSGKVIMPGGWREKRELTAPHKENLRLAGQGGTTTFHHESVSCWTVYAGPQKTEYNIIFVKPQGGDFAASLLTGFDIGLCQIAYGSTGIVTLPAYDRDAANAIITLVNPDDGTRAHLERLVKKYPDWKVCDAGRALLAKPLPKPKTRSFSGGRNTGAR